MVTPRLFEAYLACRTKCFLRSTGAVGDENSFAAWTERMNESYGRVAIQKLPSDGKVVLDHLCQSENSGVEIYALQTVGRGKTPQSKLIPLRFVASNKVSRSDRLMAAFDALIISKALRIRIDVAKIIYGDKRSALSIKTKMLFREVSKVIDDIRNLLSNSSPPTLVLNNHCPECEYRDRCRRDATDKNDLSLLTNLSEKDRTSLNKKGIFTVHQLSYTFRPRRRPKRLASRPEKYHHALKALAIREGKIHMVGDARLQIDGTPVIFDVEGIPDRDLFYLIGVRCERPQAVTKHHLWADSAEDESELWKNFLSILAEINEPVLLHYGNYEKSFLHQMVRRYGAPDEQSSVGRAIRNPVNVLSFIYARVYFPTYSNGLKEIAGFLGYKWSDPSSSGVQSIVWRHQWEESRNSALREALIVYNADDCAALSLVIRSLRQLGPSVQADDALTASKNAVIYVETLAKIPGPKWRRFESPLPELVQVNAAAYFNYQRDRVFVRSGAVRRKNLAKSRRKKSCTGPEKTLVIGAPNFCPECGGAWRKRRAILIRTVQDLIFGRDSIKRRLIKYRFQPHHCLDCKKPFALHDWYQRGRARKLGWNVRSYFVYHAVRLAIPQLTIEDNLNRLFGFELRRSTLNNLKSTAAEFYSITAARILERITKGNLIHIDETAANIKGTAAYVWVMTNLHEVVYVLAESREAHIAKTLLKDFRGVLVSDFYAAYDGIESEQQKCLIHLMRDLNDEILNNPFDDEMKSIVARFAAVLKAIVDTIDRRGLKRHFLQKHRKQVDHFYAHLHRSDFKSEAALKCKQRFQKNREKLFTFLAHDGVPWNNNNAEHAIKAFARLRRVISGTSTKKGIEEYLVLLTVAQTCEYSGIDFLEFLRSGDRNIRATRKSENLRQQSRFRLGSDNGGPSGMHI